MIASDVKKRKSLFATRALFILLFSLLLPKEGNAQKKVEALRDYKRVAGDNRGIPRGFYFEDRHHDLDKFTGEWEGAGFGGYQWRARIAVQKKSDYAGFYWSDVLGLELSIMKDSKAAITPTGNLIPGTSFIQGSWLHWDREKRSVDPNIYTMLFSYGEADHPYKGAVQVLLCMNADQDTIVIRRGIIIEVDVIANIPDYIPSGGDLAEVCTLRRVKK